MSRSSSNRNVIIVVLLLLGGITFFCIVLCGVAAAFLFRSSSPNKTVTAPAGMAFGPGSATIVDQQRHREQQQMRELQRQQQEIERQERERQLQLEQEARERQKRAELRASVLGDLNDPHSSGEFGVPLPAEPPAVTLPLPTAALPPLKYANTKIEVGERFGWIDNRGRDTKFVDLAPPGGVLVGAVAFQTPRFGKTIAGIQPVYQVQDLYVTGAICGTETDDTKVSLADAGNAVSGCGLSTGLVVDSLGFTFAPLVDLKLALDEGSSGQQMGAIDRDLPKRWSGESKLIVGIYGSFEKGSNLRSFGMLYADQVEADDAAPKPLPFRTYTSANGKFTIEARLLSVNDDGTVSLLKQDGKQISVPLVSLSEADQTFIGAQP
ncbi:SHD1 domain-containing protein [Blastopirellula marina]|uniref:SLA1 homology domain-containing protein n=1 Tax=Blastopirellula marina TaxID=124 RepID=A0A2S8GJW6_9BACT|nr:SHD1 domain-containing protein [Blastopirellula marina]PQO44738.1 hypothetical protein C5Y93_18415 [Blastopirellula marina]